MAASFPLEVHFVHQSADGHPWPWSACFFVVGPANENLAQLIAHFPAGFGAADLPADKIELDLRPPVDTTAYHYAGSLTTPPCTEGVDWYIFRQPVTASREQIAAFETRLHHNHRPVQPLNGRVVEVVRDRRPAVAWATAGREVTSLRPGSRSGARR